jgi:hypothetical protein
MIDQARLEAILVRLARRYAPTLAPLNWHRPSDYRGKLSEFASALAGHNVLVMAGSLPPVHAAESAPLVTQWVEGYVRLYDLLTAALFPSFNQINANYADAEQPPIVFLYGSATPVVSALAGFITPYVASRQSKLSVTDFELLGLMEIALDELEAGDLPREQYRLLREECAAQLRRMLSAEVRQLRLTEPKRALSEAFKLEDTGASQTMIIVDLAHEPAYPPEADPPTMPFVPPEMDIMPPPPPDKLPEEDALPNPAQDNPFGATIPIFFERKPHDTQRRPPIPPIPDLPEQPS